MIPYAIGNVVGFAAYREYKQMRKRLIVEWKNTFLRMHPEQRHKEKVALVNALKANPLCLGLRIRWQLLLEVEND